MVALRRSFSTKVRTSGLATFSWAKGICVARVPWAVQRVRLVASSRTVRRRRADMRKWCSEHAARHAVPKTSCYGDCFVIFSPATSPSPINFSYVQRASHRNVHLKPLVRPVREGRAWKMDVFLFLANVLRMVPRHNSLAQYLQYVFFIIQPFLPCPFAIFDTQ
jgi:hypothetical protein